MQNTNKVTVIIPALNEEKNIGKVIDKIRNSKNLDEIIVVNNASTDNTAEVARQHNAKVVFCENKGKPGSDPAQLLWMRPGCSHHRPGT